MRMIRNRRRSDPPGGGEPCRMCGATVPVGDDGRCRLGHRVRAASDSSPTPEAAPPSPQPASVPAREEAPASQQPDLPWRETPEAHPYDEMLAGDPAPAPAPPNQVGDDHTNQVGDDHTNQVGDDHTNQVGDDLRTALDELLAWDDTAPSALDVAVDELPEVTPMAPAPAQPTMDQDVDDEEPQPAERADRRHRLATRFGAGAALALVVGAAAILA